MNRKTQTIDRAKMYVARLPVFCSWNVVPVHS